MAVTVGGTSITFNDGTTQTTAAGAVTTTSVLNATAGASAAAVGTYVTAYPANNTGSYTFNSNYSGSSLRRSNGMIWEGQYNYYYDSGFSALSGTYKFIGSTTNNAVTNGKFALWLRVA